METWDLAKWFKSISWKIVSFLTPMYFSLSHLPNLLISQSPLYEICLFYPNAKEVAKKPLKKCHTTHMRIGRFSWLLLHFLSLYLGATTALWPINNYLHNCLHASSGCIMQCCIALLQQQQKTKIQNTYTMWLENTQWYYLRFSYM